MKYIIYHQVKQGVDCPDGIMAAAIAQKGDPDFLMIGDWYNSGRKDSELFKFGSPTKVVVVDFSYPADRLLDWQQRGVNVTLIDHHAPKFPELSGFSGAILDADECGATLAWKHFFPDQPMPLILEHVRRRDIGADGYYKAPENCLDSKQITAALSKIRSESQCGVSYLQRVLKYNEGGIEGLRQVGERLQTEDEARASDLAEKAEYAYLPSESGNWISTKKVVIEDPKDDRLVSQIGAAICQRHAPGIIAWIVASSGENSLRSSGVDISGIAKALGGGGHPFAAGFPKID